MYTSVHTWLGVLRMPRARNATRRRDAIYHHVHRLPSRVPACVLICFVSVCTQRWGTDIAAICWRWGVVERQASSDTLDDWVKHVSRAGRFVKRSKRSGRVEIFIQQNMHIICIFSRCLNVCKRATYLHTSETYYCVFVWFETSYISGRSATDLEWLLLLVCGDAICYTEGVLYVLCSMD